jgi:hypothetical protein
MYDIALNQAKRRFGLVADVERHLMAIGFAFASSNFGILKKSATPRLSNAEVLEIAASSE